MERGDNVRDYTHASRTFVDNNYELQPRQSNLFHVVFNFTPDIARSITNIQKLEVPLLVKSAQLPTYSIDIETHNQYNRSVQSQHRITYNPVNITFHDDQKDLIRGLWYKYMSFYYPDSTYQLGKGNYSTDDRYENYQAKGHGYQIGKPRFFSDIRIYSMFQKRFAEYTLVNPIITSFNHGEHAYAEGAFLEHTMALNYETVKYATGFVNNINPRGFGDVHYDNTPSPIGIFGRGPSNSIFFGGGLVDAANVVGKDLASGNILGAITKGAIIFNNTKGANLKDVVFKDLQRAAGEVIRGKNPLTGIVTPLIPSNFTGGISNIFGTGSRQAPAGDPNKVFSNGSSVFNAQFFGEDFDESDIPVGNSSVTPVKKQTVANIQKLSDVQIIRSPSLPVNTNQDIVNGLNNRITRLSSQINNSSGNTQALERERSNLITRVQLKTSSRTVNTTSGGGSTTTRRVTNPDGTISVVTTTDT